LSPATHVIVSLATGLSFALLATWIARHGAVIPGIDNRIHAWAVSHRSSASTTFARVITWGGVTAVTLPALVAVGALASQGAGTLRRRLGAGVLLSGVAGAGVYVGLQIQAVLGRTRPPIADWAGAAGGPAFPSGHTITGTLFAASCAWAFAARARSGWPRVAIWAGAAVYAAAVGWSRVWLGVHWPTDVVGGWLYSVTWFAGTMAAILAVRRRIAANEAASPR
jgi:undecaprenyl-diphosphatase